MIIFIMDIIADMMGEDIMVKVIIINHAYFKVEFVKKFIFLIKLIKIYFNNISQTILLNYLFSYENINQIKIAHLF